MTNESVTDMTRGVYRRLYAGFTKGQRINKLSLQAEAWFWRVLATVDDFGNADADPDLCHAVTAGRRKVTPKQVSDWLREMRDVGLIEFYTAKGEPFLHVIGFEAGQPAGKNGKRLKKFPFPDIQNNPGESRIIQAVPDVSSAPDNHSHSDNHTESLVAQAQRVFVFWQEHLDHGKAKLDDVRNRKILARLKDGYSVDDLMAAIRGCKLDPFSMGNNDRNQPFDDIELICRDAAHVDKFLRIAGVEVPTVEDRAEREARLSKKMGWDKLDQRTA